MEVIEIIEIIIKLGVGLSILNVWLIKRDKETPFRGGGAMSMQEEFMSYGLSKKAMIAVGTFKCLFAVLLLISIFNSSKVLEYAGAIGIAVLMSGAILMHVKISDPAKKSIPAAIFLVLSVAVLFL